MTPRTKTVAQQTNRPALYGRVYWGQFPAGHDNAISPEIIANRNRLASDYRLKSLPAANTTTRRGKARTTSTTASCTGQRTAGSC
jgi:hypothetical protein